MSDWSEGVATSAATSPTSRDTETESSQLPVAGPYNFGILKANLLRGRLQDDDKYEALKHLDQPLESRSIIATVEICGRQAGTIFEKLEELRRSRL